MLIYTGTILLHKPSLAIQQLGTLILFLQLQPLHDDSRFPRHARSPAHHVSISETRWQGTVLTRGFGNDTSVYTGYEGTRSAGM